MGPQVDTREIVRATRYVTPLREGGSMPGLMEADDDGLYVVKFRAAGQGTLALVAEVICAELATRCGLNVPQRTLVDVAPEIGVAEPDPEIQELIVESPGVNLGSDFLPGSLTYSPAGAWQPTAELAAKVVWLDAFTMNVDRTPRNPNLLVWHEDLWLIDHGAALYQQHAGLDPAKAGGAFPQIADHVLLPRASEIAAAGDAMAAAIGVDGIAEAVAATPSEWFAGTAPAVYVDYLTARLEQRAGFEAEAEAARG